MEPIPASWLSRQSFTGYCSAPNGSMRKLLEEVVDRKMQPGTLPQAVKKILGFVFEDYRWYGKSEAQPRAEKE